MCLRDQKRQICFHLTKKEGGEGGRGRGGGKAEGEGEGEGGEETELGNSVLFPTTFRKNLAIPENWGQRVPVGFPIPLYLDTFWKQFTEWVHKKHVDKGHLDFSKVNVTK